MKDLSSRKPSFSLSNASPRTIIIGFLSLLLIGLVIIMILFA